MRWKYTLAGVALLAAVAATLGFFWPFRNNHSTLRLPGVVEIQEVRLSSKVGGRVAEVHVAEGELVQAGDRLVTFEVPELKAQRDQWAARLRLAQAELSKIESGLRAEEEAARAAVAAAQAKLDRLKAARPQEIEQAQGELDGAEAEVRRATREYNRLTELRRQNPSGVSQTEYDAALAAQDRAKSQAHAAAARLELLRASFPADQREAEAEVRRAEANHHLLTYTRPEDVAAAKARVAEAQARLQEIDVNLKEQVVTAPEKAVVEVVAVRKGDVVPPSQPVVRVLRADDLWVKVYVPETQLAKIRLNEEVTVTVDGYPGRQFKGRVEQIASESEFTPRNVQSPDERRHQVFGVKVRVPDPEGIFKSGLAAEVTIPLR
jgi:multidrug resistance efflux pump